MTENEMTMCEKCMFGQYGFCEKKYDTYSEDCEFEPDIEIELTIHNGKIGEFEENEPNTKDIGINLDDYIFKERTETRDSYDMTGNGDYVRKTGFLR